MLKETCNVETAYGMKPEVRCSQGDWLSHRVNWSKLHTNPDTSGSPTPTGAVRQDRHGRRAHRAQWHQGTALTIRYGKRCVPLALLTTSPAKAS